MGLHFSLRSFPVRLVLGMVALILLTTLSAGAPAYWLTHTELERQAWLRVDGAQRATQSLFQAKQEQLTGVATLLAERPTLQRLLRAQALAELDPYAHTFQSQSGVDLLLLCDLAGEILAGEITMGDAPSSLCLLLLPAQFQIVAGRPASLVSRWIVDEGSGAQLGRVVLGNWLDGVSLGQMASDTGVAQSILLADGARVASTLPLDVSGGLRPVGDGRGFLSVGETAYYVSSFPITHAQATTPLWVEVALPVNDLLATQDRALLILVASTGFVVLLGIVCGIWYVRKLTTPLQQLTQVAGAISRGELTTRVPSLPGPLEVTILTAALQKSQESMLRAVEDLAQARDWLDTLVQSIVEGVVTFDGAGHVTFLNQTAAALTPFSPAEAMGRHVNDLFRVSEEGTVHFLDLLPAQGAKARVAIVRPGGESRPPRVMARPGQRSPRRIGSTAASTPKTMWEITGARLPGLGGEAAQTVLVLRDISEAEALRYLRSYFLANITHEFRTPLSTLSASIDLLMEEADTLSPAEMRELLKPVHLSLLGLRTLIDNLLDSSTIEAGRFGIRKGPLDLDQIVAAALQMVQPLLERRQQSLALTESAELPQIQGDAARLTQVLVNLLTNASKYSPMGQPIDLILEPHPDRVRIAIADRGTGIPPSERANLFRSFVRMNPQDAEQYGIGLGLYVVKTTVEAHGGRVGVDDRPGGGSIFWFDLPLNPGEDAR